MRCVAGVVVVLFRARLTVARSRVGWSRGDILGFGAACPAVRAPGFGFRVCRSAGLVAVGWYEAAVLYPWGMLRGWARVSWEIVAADGGPCSSVFAAVVFCRESALARLQRELRALFGGCHGC